MSIKTHAWVNSCSFRLRTLCLIRVYTVCFSDTSTGSKINLFKFQQGKMSGCLNSNTCLGFFFFFFFFFFCVFYLFVVVVVVVVVFYPPLWLASWNICCFIRSEEVEYHLKWRRNLDRDVSWTGQGGNKLRTYRTFKQEHGTEPYISSILPSRHRSSYAKFRCGVAPIRLETGRYERKSPILTIWPMARNCLWFSAVWI